MTSLLAQVDKVVLVVDSWADLCATPFAQLRIHVARASLDNMCCLHEQAMMLCFCSSMPAQQRVLRQPLAFFEPCNSAHAIRAFYSVLGKQPAIHCRIASLFRQHCGVYCL